MICRTCQDAADRPPLKMELGGGELAEPAAIRSHHVPRRNVVRLPTPTARRWVEPMTGVARRAPWEWMKANDLPSRIPDDAYLVVDEGAQTITIEVFAQDAEGRQMLHGNTFMTTVATFPLKVLPPPGLLDAYQQTTRRIRRQRDAATAIRYETADALIERLGLDPLKVFEALELPVPTTRLQEVP